MTSNCSKTFAIIILVALLFSFCEAEVKSKRNQRTKKYQFQDKTMLSNLFLQEKEIIIQAEILNKKKQSLSMKRTSFILEEEYMQMYKSRMNLQIPLTMDQRIFLDKDIVMQISLFVVLNQKPKFLLAQNISMIKYFTKIRRQGLELFLSADFYQLFLAQQPHILESLDVYLFEAQAQIQADSLKKSQLYKKYNSSHYFAKPLIQKVNQVDRNQYKKLSELQIDQVHNIKVNIKLKSEFTLLIMNLILNIGQNQTMNQGFEKEQQSIMSSFQLAQYNNLITLFIKKLWLESSNLGIIFFYVKVILFFLFVPISSFMVLIYQIKMFRNISKFKGISMVYFISNAFYCGMLILVSKFSNQKNQLTQSGISPFILQGLFYWWLVSKVTNIKFVDQFPFIGLKREPWYEKYFHVEKKVIKKTFLYLIPFFLAFQLCPILIQSKQPTIDLFLARFAQFFQLYSFLLLFIPQIIMNYQLKSTEGVSWKFIFWYLCFYLNDVFTLMICNSYTSILFYLKEEILIFVLYYQRSIYKNNKCQLLQDDIQQENDNNRQNQAQQAQQTQQVGEKKYADVSISCNIDEENNQGSKISDSQQRGEQIDSELKLQQRAYEEQRAQSHHQNQNHQKTE